MGLDKQKRIELVAGSAQFYSTSAAGATISNRGISVLTAKTTAGTSTQLYTLAAPVRAGLEKIVFVTNATSSRSVRLTAAAGSGYYSTNAQHSTGITKLTFKTRAFGVRLVSFSTKAWVQQSLSTRPPALS
jgi:hypothetical protein